MGNLGQWLRAADLNGGSGVLLVLGSVSVGLRDRLSLFIPRLIGRVAAFRAFRRPERRQGSNSCITRKLPYSSKEFQTLTVIQCHHLLAPLPWFSHQLLPRELNKGEVRNHFHWMQIVYCPV